LGGFEDAFCSASSPSTAVSTSKPSSSKLILTTVRMSGSSSATRTRSLIKRPSQFFHCVCGIVNPEDGRPGHHHRRTGIDDAADVGGGDSSVDLNIGTQTPGLNPFSGFG